MGKSAGLRGVLALALLLIAAAPAYADMGPMVIVPVIGGAVWHIVLGVVTVLPRFMAGRRAASAKVYAGVVALAWVINLGLPVDGFADFWVLFSLPLVASLGLMILGWRTGRASPPL